METTGTLDGVNWLNYTDTTHTYKHTYMTGFKKSWLPRTQQEDTLFNIK